MAILLACLLLQQSRTFSILNITRWANKYAVKIYYDYVNMCINLGEWYFVIVLFISVQKRYKSWYLNKCLLHKLCTVPRRHIAQTRKHCCTKNSPLMNRSVSMSTEFLAIASQSSNADFFTCNISLYMYTSCNWPGKIYRPFFSVVIVKPERRNQGG